MKGKGLIGTIAIILIVVLVISFSPGISDNYGQESESSLASVKFSNTQMIILSALAIIIILTLIILFLEDKKK